MYQYSISEISDLAPPLSISLFLLALLPKLKHCLLAMHQSSHYFGESRARDVPAWLC